MLVKKHIAFLLVAMLALSACTVVPIDQTTSPGATSSGPFDAKQYVDSIWSSKVIPTIHQKAVDLNTLIPALQKDPAAASKKYGNEAAGSYSFMVKGQGKVTKVDTSSPNGTAIVQLSQGNNLPPVTLQVGPLILDESLRDAVGFIGFNDFQNQIDYGDVSSALNDKAAQVIANSVKPADLQGKTVSFYGTFTLTDPNQIIITPVEINVVS